MLDLDVRPCTPEETEEVLAALDPDTAAVLALIDECGYEAVLASGLIDEFFVTLESLED